MLLNKNILLFLAFCIFILTIDGKRPKFICGDPCEIGNNLALLDCSGSGPVPPPVTTCECVCTPITQLDIVSGYTISQSGAYTVIEALTYLTSGAVITISANNVVLDFCDVPVQYAGASNLLSYGVVISQGYSNIWIKNGLISGFTQYGLYMQGGNNNVQITNMQVSNCGLGGFLIKNASTCILDSCTAIINKNYGYLFQACNNCKINKCNAYSNGISGTNVYGFGFIQGYSNISTCCEASFNTGTSFGSGFYFDLNESNSKLENCTATLNGSSSGIGYGVVLGSAGGTTAINCILENCYFSKNYGNSRQYGVFDFATSTTTSLISNRSEFHGAVFPGGSTMSTTSTTMNYKLNYTGVFNPLYIIQEVTSSNIVAPTFNSGLINLSIY